MSRNMPSAVRQHALQIAHHEMGHYVVARSLGFATGGVSLTVTMDLRHHGGAAITLARPLASMAAMKAHLEARMMVLFAGVMAQTLSSAGVDKSKAIAILKGALGAEHDYAKIKELQHLLRNISYLETDPASAERIANELKAVTDRVWDGPNSSDSRGPGRHHHRIGAHAGRRHGYRRTVGQGGRYLRSGVQP